MTKGKQKVEEHCYIVQATFLKYGQRQAYQVFAFSIGAAIELAGTSWAEDVWEDSCGQSSGPSLKSCEKEFIDNITMVVRVNDLAAI